MKLKIHDIHPVAAQDWRIENDEPATTWGNVACHAVAALFAATPVAPNPNRPGNTHPASVATPIPPITQRDISI